MNTTPTIVITGGAGGLGTAVTRLFLARGCAVYAPVHSEKSAAELRQQIDSFIDSSGVERLTTPVVDLLDESDVSRFYETILAGSGRIDALVHLIGGVRKWAEASEMTMEDWDAVMNLNLRSAFLNARAAMRPMTAQKNGSIVLISAMTALRPEAKKSAYAAAKAGVIALARALADEGRTHNINVNAIAPGIIRTAANLAWASAGEESAWVAPEDIAETIYFLTSPHARHITGTVIRATGGLQQ